MEEIIEQLGPHVLYRHMPVHLSNGSRLGRVEEIGHGGDVLHIQQGNVLVYDWYVPVDAVSTVDERGVHLKVSLRDLRKNGWNVPPEAYLMRQGATPGYEYSRLGRVGGEQLR